MKKIIFAIVACLMSVSMFGQKTLNKEAADTTIVYAHARYYHYDKNCESLVGKEFKERTVKVAARSYWQCEKCAPDSLKRNKIKITMKPVIDNEIYNAGKYLKKSANLRYASYGCILAGGICSGAQAFANNHGEGDDGIVGYCFGGAFGVAALVCDIVSIHYKQKAGKSLMIGAGKITYNF